MQQRTIPEETAGMPPGIPHIIGNEAAERFSFYGMKAILAVFFTQYLFLMDGTGGTPMSESRSAKPFIGLTALSTSPRLSALSSPMACLENTESSFGFHSSIAQATEPSP